MDIEILKNQFFTEENFAKEQFIFEKVIVDQIIQQCNPLPIDQFQQCKQHYFKIRRSYKDDVNTFFIKQNERLIHQMTDKCLRLPNDDEFVQCLSKISDLNKKFVGDKLKYFKEQRRTLTQNVLKEKKK